MPPAKRSSTSKPKSSASKSSNARSASAGAKATRTTARKATGRTATQAKSATTKTSRTAKAGAKSTAKAAGAAVADTAKTAKAGAKGTATAARGGAKQTTTRAKAANTRARNTEGGRPGAAVMLTRERIQEVLDDAAARGRVTSREANELVTELMRRGVASGEDVRDEVGELIGKGRKGLETAGRKVRKAEPVDRLVRGADRARRAAGVGPSFPIIGYDDLNASQVQARVKELSRADQRKVLNYERKNADRKSVVSALEKSLA